MKFRALIGAALMAAGLLVSGRAEAQELTVQRVIDCRGQGGDVARQGGPLLRQLLADGLARPDPFGLGLDTTPQGTLLDPDGNPLPSLLAIGPLTQSLLPLCTVPFTRQFLLPEER